MRSHTTTKPLPKSYFTPARSPLLQRKCDCGNSAGLTGKCSACQEKSLTLQRRSKNQTELTEVPPIVHEVLNSPGQSLDHQTLNFMGSHFEHDFSQVSVHTDSKAAESAQAINALAYTVRQNVVFGAGQFAPNTTTGKRILAHELTHVVQQSHQGLTPSLQRQSSTGTQSDALEVEADQIAQNVVTKSPKKKASSPQKKKTKKAVSSLLTFAQVEKYILSNNNSSLSKEFLLCLIWKESGFDPKTKNSSSSATGLMQMTKGAVTEVNKNTPKGVHFNHSEMTDPEKNIACGTYYLTIRIKWAKGNIKKGVEGFGTGAGYADKILDCETCLQKQPPEPNDCLFTIHK